MINIQENISLAPLTSFRVGGNAKFYVEVSSVDDLKEALNFAKEKKLDYFLLGGGTNLLVSDKGFDGLVLKMKMNTVCLSDNRIEADAGVPLIKVINMAAQSGLSGMELMAGIPGTIGGAVRGNAGAYGTEICQVIKKVKIFNTENGEITDVENDSCDFSYRSSMFKKNPKFIVVSVLLELQNSDPESVQKKTSETIAKRVAMGLGGYKSAGSFFMNPTVKNQKLKEEFEKEKGEAARADKLPAGWVIEQAGLKGKKIGGAAVCDKHSNYIINAENATAEEVMILVSYIKQQVRDQFGIQLQEEVNYIGF